MPAGAILQVQIVGDSSGLASSLKSAGAQVSGFAGAVQSVGSTIGGALVTGTKIVAGLWTGTAIAAGAAATNVFKTGVAYNQLNQTAGAAFRTILGSQAAADDFMKSLSAFAKTSPFPKQAFITAAQQMMAFGIQTQKVVPYLNAVQDAVAAAGGGAQQLSEVTTIMAQISSAGKITGQDLLQFGARGINAAQLIGSQMGMTAEQIRASITAGTLDAGQALDALAAGMESSFGGAAALVKQTWAGATDSVKAAIRDLGGALAEPFVSAGGGGLAVGWAEQVSTVIRALIPIVTALMDKLLQTFGPTLQAIGPILDSIAGKLSGLNVDNIAGGISGMLPVIGGLTGAFAAMSGGLLSNIPIIGSALGALSGPVGIVTAAIAGLIATSPELQAVLGTALQGAMAAIAPLLPVISGALKQLAGVFGQVITAVAPLIPILVGVLGQALATVAKLVVNLATAALPLVTAAVSILSPLLQAVGQIFVALAAPVQMLVSNLLPPLVGIITTVLAAITPLIPVIGQLAVALIQIATSVLTPVIQLLGALLAGFTPLIGPILQVAVSVVSLIVPIVQLVAIALKPLMSIITPLLPLITVLAQLLSALLGPIISLITPLITLASSALGKAVTAFSSFISTASGANGVMSAIAGVINTVVSAIQSLIGWIGKIHWPSPPAWLSQVGSIIGLSASAAPPKSSGVSYSAPRSPIADTYVTRLRGGRLGASQYQAATPATPTIQITVQAPYGGGDEIARTIRKELVKLTRRESGVLLAGVA